MARGIEMSARRRWWAVRNLLLRGKALYSVRLHLELLVFPPVGYLSTPGAGRSETAVPSKIRTSEVLVVAGARFLSKLMPLVILGTILSICLIVYAIAWMLR